VFLVFGRVSCTDRRVVRDTASVTTLCPHSGYLIPNEANDAFFIIDFLFCFCCCLWTLFRVEDIVKRIYLIRPRVFRLGSFLRRDENDVGFYISRKIRNVIQAHTICGQYVKSALLLMNCRRLRTVLQRSLSDRSTKLPRVTSSGTFRFDRPKRRLISVTRSSRT